MMHISRIQRIELALFIACFFAFAYFNQGGGWNQNARFAEVRAIVEEGRFPIDNFLVYRKNASGDDLDRIPVTKAEYEVDGRRFRLSWVDMEWNLFPVGEHPLGEGVGKAPMVEMCSSGDIGYVEKTGHFHPNKPPGTSFFGVPGYFVIHRLEKALGIDPDHWWTLNLNAWLTTVCSVGIFSAIGCIVFFRLARDFAGGALFPAVLATITMAFGTTYFPFGTIFFDHNLTAALALIAFYLLWRARVRPDHSPSQQRQDRLHLLAGLAAGFAAITNYVAAVVVIFFGLYALLASKRGRWNWRAAIAYSLGVLPPFLLICWYGWLNFGSPFVTNNHFQNPLFTDEGGALGMFALPNGYIASLLLFSPFRGLFYLAPVLAFGLGGIVVWLWEKQLAPEARVCLAISVSFFLVNASFNGYHAGFSAGPRYLVPGIPFLALPLVVAFGRARCRVSLSVFAFFAWVCVSFIIWTASIPVVAQIGLWIVSLLAAVGLVIQQRVFWVASVAAAISIGTHLTLTVTDGQNPTGVGGHARVEGRRTEWSYNLMADYAWPLFAYGRAWPLLNEQMEVHMEKENDRIAAEQEDPEIQKRESEALEEELRGTIDRGESSPFLLGTVVGPVSVNPVGVYEGLFTYNFFPPGAVQSRWASFNVGELLPPQSLWEGSRLSLLPLLLITGGLCVWAARAARSAGMTGAGMTNDQAPMTNRPPVSCK